MKRIKTNIVRNKKGFTLLELLIGLSLFSVIIILGYSFLRFSKTTHKKAVDKVELHQSLKEAIDFISDELSTSLYIRIQNKRFNHSDYLEDDKFIESDGESIKYYFYKEDENKNGKWSQNVIFDYKNKLEIKKADTDNVVNITIRVLDDNNREIDSISTKVYASNMLEGRPNIDSIQGGGSYIQYNNTTKESSLPAPNRMRYCFFNALWHSNHPYVLVLREFRDNYLAKYNWGREFIDYYYRISPKYADIIGKSHTIRFLTGVLLAPLVTIIFITMRVPNYILILITLLSIVYFHKRRIEKGGHAFEITILK